MKHKDDVAIKAVRKVDRYTDSARIEADILNNLYDKQKEVAADFCVDLYSTLIYDGMIRFIIHSPTLCYLVGVT